MIGGHEGAGVIEQVGPGLHRLFPGDHVVFGFVPACGDCPSCASGHSNLCDNGARITGGPCRPTEPAAITPRVRTSAPCCCLGTFAKAHGGQHHASCVKIPDHIPMDKACLVGCGVTTGWGSAVYAAEVRPGDNVIVIGIGGIGASAIQGAKLAGAERIFAIDPVRVQTARRPNEVRCHPHRGQCARRPRPWSTR